MRLLAAIPLLAIPVILANVLAFAGDQGLDHLWFLVPLPSGAQVGLAMDSVEPPATRSVEPTEPS